jgi:hypothetical protein
VKKADRLTTIPGPRRFVLTLWPKRQDEALALPLYLGMDIQQAQDLCSLIQSWMNTQRPAISLDESSLSLVQHVDPKVLPSAQTYLFREPEPSEVSEDRRSPNRPASPVPSPRAEPTSSMPSTAPPAPSRDRQASPRTTPAHSPWPSLG